MTNTNKTTRSKPGRVKLSKTNKKYTGQRDHVNTPQSTKPSQEHVTLVYLQKYYDSVSWYHRRRKVPKWFVTQQPTRVPQGLAWAQIAQQQIPTSASSTDGVLQSRRVWRSFVWALWLRRFRDICSQYEDFCVFFGE